MTDKKRLDELKLKDKINNFEITLRNMKDRIDFLEKNNVDLQTELDTQEQKIEDFLNNIIKAKIASDCVPKESDDPKTRLLKAKKKIALRSYYGMGAQISGADALVKEFKKEHNLDSKNSRYGDPDKIKVQNIWDTIKSRRENKDDQNAQIWNIFDKPDDSVDQVVVNETLLGKREDYVPYYNRFSKNSSRKEIYFKLFNKKNMYTYLVVNFEKKEIYFSEWMEGINLFKSKHVINNCVELEGFSVIQTKNKNYIVKSKSYIGENFCLYIDFSKWRVSMYRYDSTSNSWVIHEFIEFPNVIV